MTTLILVAVVAFASTNLDDIFVLLSLFADRSLKPAEVVAGQYLGMAILTLIALVGSFAALVVPGTRVGLLGVLPLAIGLRRLWTRQAGDDHSEPRGAKGSLGKVIAAAAVTTANGGDNIAVYVPLLVGKSPGEVTVVIVVFGSMTAAWCVIARFVVDHPRMGLPIRRIGRLLVPWIYIGLGIDILVASRAYTLIGIGAR